MGAFPSYPENHQREKWSWVEWEMCMYVRGNRQQCRCRRKKLSAWYGFNKLVRRCAVRTRCQAVRPADPEGGYQMWRRVFRHSLRASARAHTHIHTWTYNLGTSFLFQHHLSFIVCWDTWHTTSINTDMKAHTIMAIIKITKQFSLYTRVIICNMKEETKRRESKVGQEGHLRKWDGLESEVEYKP